MVNEIKKLRIGIDLDDVVFDFVNFLLLNYEKEFKKKILFEDITSFYFAPIFNFSEEECFAFIKQILSKKNVENLQLLEGAQNSINLLAKVHKIYFVTSRVFREGTLKSLKKHFVEIDFELVFSSNPYAKTKGRTKGEICKELGINFMIEDSKEHSEICAEKGIKTFLLNKPWNKECKEHENIIRVNGWNEILERLK